MPITITVENIISTDDADTMLSSLRRMIGTSDIRVTAMYIPAPEPEPEPEPSVVSDVDAPAAVSEQVIRATKHVPSPLFDEIREHVSPDKSVLLQIHGEGAQEISLYTAAVLWCMNKYSTAWGSVPQRIMAMVNQLGYDPIITDSVYKELLSVTGLIGEDLKTFRMGASYIDFGDGWRPLGFAPHERTTPLKPTSKE